MIGQVMGYRVNDAAAALGVGRDVIYDLLRQGRIRAVKLGRCTVIPRTELERLLQEGLEGGDATT